MTQAVGVQLHCDFLSLLFVQATSEFLMNTYGSPSTGLTQCITLTCSCQKPLCELCDARPRREDFFRKDQGSEERHRRDVHARRKLLALPPTVRSLAPRAQQFPNLCPCLNPRICRGTGPRPAVLPDPPHLAP